MYTLVTRSKEKSCKTIEELKKLGLKVISEPLFRINYQPDFTNAIVKLLNSEIKIIITSSTVLEALYPIKGYLKDIELIMVGKHSTHLARSLGFNAIFGGIDAYSLIKFIKRNFKIDSKFIYLTGNYTSINLQESLNPLGYEIDNILVYETVYKKKLSKRVINYLQQKKIDKIIFYSSKMAECFINLLKQNTLEEELKFIKAFALSNKIKAQLQNVEWKTIKVARMPSEESLITLIKSELK